MKKLNRILSLVICLMLTVTSFAFVNTSVDAAEELLNDTVRCLSAVTVEDTEYEGIACKSYTRSGTNRLDALIDIPYDKINNDNWLVLESKFAFNDAVTNVQIGSGMTDTGSLTAWSAKVPDDDFNDPGWNTIKLVFKNIDQSKGYLYINDELHSEVTVTANAAHLRIVFNKVSGATSSTANRKFWMQYAKLTQLSDNMVKYYDINGDVYQSQNVADGEKASIIDAPVVEHYDFLGWYEKDAEAEYNFDTELNYHLDLYAKYEAKTYDVVFKADGEQIDVLSGKYGEALNAPLPAIPEKDGYAVVGWYIGDTNEEFTEDTVISGSDMVINARYVENALPEYTVTFEADGSVYATETVFEGYTVTLPTDPEKEHYTFGGWLYDGAAFDESTAITSNITLEAKFNPVSYKVSFYMNEKMNDLYSEETREYNSAYGTLPVPELSGFNFVGWKTSDGEDFTEETLVKGNVSLYAVWESNAKVILDEDITKYTSLKGNLVEFIISKQDNSIIDFNNGLNIRIAEDTPKDRNFGNNITALLRIPVGEYDAQNRAQLYNNFAGEYQVDVTFDVKLSGKYTAADGTSVTAPYATITTGMYADGVFKKLLHNRLRVSSFEAMNSDSISKTSFNSLPVDDPAKVGTVEKISYPGYEDGKAENVTLQIKYDTVTYNTYLTLTDADSYAFGEPAEKLPYINGFHISLMNCFRKGDYVNIKRIKVTEINNYSETEEHKADYEALQAKVAMLPDALVSDANDATGVANLANIDGVTWTSSNEDVVSSTTGAITKSYADEEVVVTATITSGIYTMTKEYSLTVKRSNKVKVSFYLDQELTNLYAEGVIDANTVYGELPVPEKNGYKFLGWKTSDGADFTAETVVSDTISVYADWKSTTNVILDEDITEYTSLTGNIVEFIHTHDANTSVYLDDGLVFQISEPRPNERTFDNSLVARFRIPEGEYDAVNRTQVFNDRFTGDVRVDITYDSTLSGKYTSDDGIAVSAPYGYISTGAYENGIFTTLLYNRLKSGKIETYNSSSASSNSFNALETGKEGQFTTFTYPSKGSPVVQIGYDTAIQSAYMTMNDGDVRAWGTAGNKLTYINSFRFQLMNAFKQGGAIKIKRVKVVQVNDYKDDIAHKADYENLNVILASLPASLVADPYDATGVANLEAINGVTWLSSNEEVVSSETGVITPLFNDEEVVVTAVVKSGIFEMTKEYNLTVKRDSRVDIKEVLNQTFKTEEDLTNWNITNLGGDGFADYKVDENGIKFTKLQPAVNPSQKYETKRYLAAYDLYQLIDSDEYSVTEAKELNGVYDVSVDLSKYSTSTIPMNIKIGYRNGNSFTNMGAVKINMDGAIFQYYKTAEKLENVELPIVDSAKLTFRIDNTLNNISVFVDDVLVVDRIDILNAGLLVNALRIELDENNNTGDYINVENITVTQLINNAGEDLDALVDAAGNIDVYDIVENPASVSGNIKSLPQNVGKYSIVWKSLSNQVDVETGKVFHDAEDKTVYVTAEIFDENAEYPLTVRKVFELNIRAAQNSSELDKFKINSLGEITRQNYDDVRYDLDLPTVDGVTWTSSNTNIITNDGKIVENAVITEPTKVVIKAKSNNEYKDYTVTVSPRTDYSVITSGAAPVALKFGNINDAKLSEDVVTTFTYTANGQVGRLDVCDENGTALVSMVAEAGGIYFDYYGTDYTKYTVTSADVKIIVMPDIDKAAIFVDGKIVADNVKLLKDANYVAKVTSDINVGDITMSTDDYGMLQANIDNIDYFADVVKGYANAEGINLPAQTLTNAVVNWTSSNTSVLGTDGKVKTPAAITDVKVGFKITDANNNKIFTEKSFDVSVDCDASKNLVAGIVPSVKFENPDYPQSNLTDDNIETFYKVVNSSASDSDIIFNLGSTKTFNSVYVLQTTAGIEDYEVYVSTDGTQWNKKASGSIAGDLSSLIQLGNVNAQYVKFVVKKSDAKEICISELKVFVSGSAKELAQYDLDSIVIDSTPAGSSINLPSKGVNGTVFTWESSDEKVISKDGKITRPSNGTTVKLTVKAVVEGQEFTKTFDVYVDSKSTSGPSQVGGGSGGGGGAGGMSSGATSTPVIGEKEETVYTETEKEETSEVVVPSTTSKYNDVKSTDWYYEAVNTLTEKSIVSGDGTGYFYPTNNVTREQFVKMILEAIEVEVSAGNVSFADVTSGAWYEAYIATAVTNGIVNGVGDGKFGVGTNITRQDMAVLIERVLNFKNIEVEKAEVEPFADAASVADYAKDAVANMKAIGLIKGYDNNYNPKDNLTRAEAATVISSLLELLAK